MNIFKNLSMVVTGAAFSTLVATGAAQAVTVIGSSSGVFGTPNPGTSSNPVFSGVGTNTFSWGKPVNTSFQNSLIFTGNAFSAAIDSVFKVGNLIYKNGTVDLDTGVDYVPLNVSLAMSSPVSVNKVFAFDFDIINTPNTGTPEQNADFVFPKNSFASSTFELAGVDYTLQLTGFSKDGGATIVDQFNVLEDGTDTAAVYGKVTTAPPAIPFEFSPNLGLLILGVWAGLVMLKTKVQKRKFLEAGTLKTKDGQPESV